jgi:hypothetical protein
MKTNKNLNESFLFNDKMFKNYCEGTTTEVIGIGRKTKENLFFL